MVKLAHKIECRDAMMYDSQRQLFSSVYRILKLKCVRPVLWLNTMACIITWECSGWLQVRAWACVHIVWLGIGPWSLRDATVRLHFDWNLLNVSLNMSVSCIFMRLKGIVWSISPPCFSKCPSAVGGSNNEKIWYNTKLKLGAKQPVLNWRGPRTVKLKLRFLALVAPQYHLLIC